LHYILTCFNLRL